MSTQTYTVYLLKDTVTSFQDALDDDKPVAQHPLISNFGAQGTLFLGQQSTSTPSWVGLLDPYLQTPITRAFTASISAVLLFLYEKRTFAFTFGHGKNLLLDTSWVRDFGLKVTLNRVDASKLRSIDAKTYEDLVRTKRTQTSRSCALNNFEIDVARDLVRGVTGDAEDKTYFKRLTGAGALNFTTDIPFGDIVDILDELLAAYSDTKYKKEFGWIDQVKEVDPLISIELDNQLVDALRASNIAGMHLAPADIVDTENVAGFNFTRGDKIKRYFELELEHYLKVLGGKLADIDLAQLRRHQVRVYFDDSDEPKNMWSVYDCLVWETHIGKRKYALFDGRWFEIADDYAAAVEAHVASLMGNPLPLPNAINGDPEETYNRSVEQADPIRFAVLDQQMVRPLGAATTVEFCDLLTTDGHIVHVKKRTSSATLSHLFSQASVSCDCFLRDPSVRDDVAAKLKGMKKAAHAELFPKDRPAPSGYHVVYVVIAPDGKSWPPALPFFSAVNLMHHSRRIQNLGFKVSLQHVRQVGRN